MKLITTRVISDEGVSFNWAFADEEQALNQTVRLLMWLAQGRDRARGYSELRIALGETHIEAK